MTDKERTSLKRADEEDRLSVKSMVPIDLQSLSDFAPGDEWRNCPSPDSPRKHVKSTAVVKYSTVQSLANFAVLQCNTDLNSPPSNWLSSSADSYGLQHVPSHSTGFSSFRMAHMFPECVGEVDVVSDAENIKKLLKIPYSKGPVSMMVHRIENTLLIDEFDIHKYLLRTAESEWEWLKKFFFEHVLQSLNEKEKGLFHKNKSRCALQQKSLVSKFLYHSLAVAQAQNDGPSEPAKPENQEAAVPIPVTVADPPLPEPKLEEEVPDPTSNHKFARNVVWTFEDIQMLIGTNLPIFGGKTHPCISLKLRDMTKPINVLTGIDYWLDNLMCNVPELVMCYHLDGIVQKYELIKTEDLPHLENSKFSPKVIRDVAQNILSFLKSNATKAGHTYWLFKGKDAEIVKLYDLTSLCSDMMDEKGQNPFTVPVAMLLYRVARNMKHSPDGQRQHGTIRMLLKNCIELLDKEKYPQIVTSAHYMLSDLYIPADTDPSSPNLAENLDDERSASEYDEGDEVEEREDNREGETNFGSSSSVEVKSLCVATSFPAGDSAPPPPLSGNVKERCNSALEHVGAGLQCLTLFGTKPEDSSEHCSASFDRNNSNREPTEPDGPSMAKPFEAIPMPYTPLKSQKQEKERSCSPSKQVPSTSSKKSKKDTSFEQDQNSPEVQLSPRSLLCKYRAEAMPTWQQPKPSDKVFWRAHLKILLHEKACLVYATLAESEYSASRYGSALRYIGMVLRCQQQLEVVAQGTLNLGLQSYLLGRAGDLCFMIVQDWANVTSHREEYSELSEVDKEVLNEVERDGSSSNSSDYLLELVPQTIDSMEQMLLASRSCYQQALLLEPLEQQCSNLRRRLGNIENELGVLFMNQAAVCYQENGLERQAGTSSALQALLNKSLHHLESGVQAFETVHDEANLALLLSNTGRLMRMCAHYHSPDSSSRSELGGQERHFYQKALTSYQKALQVLGNRKCNPDIWDTVMWELSTTLFSMATILQDFPSLGNKSSEEAEREVVEYLLKALKYCDLETPGSRQLIYQFRAATIHHRLASLYHRSFRNLPVEDSKRKNVLQLSRLHYEKASKLLLLLEHPSDFLRVQMERVALVEYQAQNATSNSVRIKHLQSAMELLCQCIPMLHVVKERLTVVDMNGKKKRQQKHPSEDSEASLAQSVQNLCVDENKQKFGQRKDTVPGVSKSSAEEDCAEKEEIESLLRLLEQRLQFVLLQLAKLHHSRGGQAKKDADNSAQLYKNLYSIALRKNDSTVGCELAKHIFCVLSETENALRQTFSGTKTR